MRTVYKIDMMFSKIYLDCRIRARDALIMEFSPGFHMALGLIPRVTQKGNNYTVWSLFLSYCLHLSDVYVHQLLVCFPRVPLCTYEVKALVWQLCPLH